MSASNVQWAIPLTRLNPWYPGQFGVPGTDNETGLRTNCTGTIFYVDPNYPGASDARDGTNPTDPLLTVAAAITKCQAYRGDVIAVMANNSNPYANTALGYATAISEEVTVNVPGVKLVGINQASSIGVVWTPASNGGTCITVTANDVLIEGFFFTEGAYTGLNAILGDYNGVTTFGDYMTVRHCVFDDTVDIAIQMEYQWYCEIAYNLFQQCDAYGVYTAAAGSGTQYSHIHHNRFIDCGTAAIALLGGADDNDVSYNAIFNTNAQGGVAAANEGINTTGGARNLVHHNTLSCLLAAGNGDYNDLCTAAATDAWVQNYCLNGPSVTNPT